MRCPNCAGEVPAGSRFCGICGRNVTVAPEPIAQVLGSASGGGQWQAAAAREAQPAMSLFELPVSRGARAAKMALVLVLDAILAGAGIVMILSYLDARSGSPAPEAKPKPPAVKVGAPKAVVPAAPKAPEAATLPAATKPQEKQATGDGQRATGSRQPKAAPMASPSPTRAAEVPVAVEAAEVEAADDEVEDVSAEMNRLVTGRAGELDRCYQRAAKLSGPSDPLAGTIEIHVTVMPDGSARDVRAGDNSTGSAQLAECAVSLFRTFSLSRGAASPVELVWPLQFRSPDK